MGVISAMMERRKQRRAFETLRGLDDHLLRDIGIDRSQLNRFNPSLMRHLPDMGN